MIHQKDDEQLLHAFPDESLQLLELGFVKIRTAGPLTEGAEPPAQAWTSWEQPLMGRGYFQINVREPYASTASKEFLRALIQHELYHVLSGHFKLPPCGTDLLVATDIEVNWWLGDDLKILEAEMPGLVKPTEWLEHLNLNPNVPYPASMLHDLLHEEAVPMEMFCGGAQPTDSKTAAAIASIGNAIAGPASGARGDALGQRWGTGAGEWAFHPTTTETPHWAKMVQEFARAFVKVTLADDRKHSRPVPVMRQIGIHVPSVKPKWAMTPHTVCFLVDVSGSMYSGNVLSQLASTVSYLQRHGITVRMIAGDTRVTMDVELRSGVWPQIIGGGGTDIVPMFDRAKEYSPKALVCLTDTEIPTWPENPGVDVLWVIPEGRSTPYGTVAVYKD